MKEKPDRTHRNSLVRALQIPEDITRGTILVSMRGRERVTVENFKGISSYNTEEIRLLTKQNKVCITGKNLKIENYSKDEIEISGIISKLEYQ